MVEPFSTVLSLAGTGIVAGVFFAVAVSVVPALGAMRPRSYVEAHQLLGRGYHPVMPVVVTVTVISDVVAAVAATGAVRWLLAGAAILLIGVQLVSQFGNVPINKRVGRMQPENLAADWFDPRPAWRVWHLRRTTFALAALALTSIAAVLA
jgi:uncharacterized membrane protein